VRGRGVSRIVHLGKDEESPSPPAIGAGRVVFVGLGGSRGTSPSLDLTFPNSGLSENLGGMERGRGGKGKGGGDHLPYFPPLASASNTTLHRGSRGAL